MLPGLKTSTSSQRPLKAKFRDIIASSSKCLSHLHLHAHHHTWHRISASSASIPSLCRLANTGVQPSGVLPHTAAPRKLRSSPQGCKLSRRAA
jgi:hypothetical protein